MEFRDSVNNNKKFFFGEIFVLLLCFLFCGLYYPPAKDHVKIVARLCILSEKEHMLSTDSTFKGGFRNN